MRSSIIVYTSAILYFSACSLLLAENTLSASDANVPPTAQARTGDVQQFCQQLTKALVQHDSSAIAALIDFHRLTTEAERQGLITPLDWPDRVGIAVALESSLPRALASAAQSSRWTSHDIVAIDTLNEYTATMTIRLKADDRLKSSLLRLRVSRTNDMWRLIDWHDLSSPFALTTFVGLNHAILREEAGHREARLLLSAAGAIAQEEYTRAATLLDRISYSSLPAAVEPAYWVLRSQIEFSRKNFKAALDAVNFSRRPTAVAPRSDYLTAGLTAEFQRQLGDHISSLQTVTDALAKFGSDAELLSLQGFAFEALGYISEAKGAYRASLGLNRDSLDSLVGLARLADTDELPQLAQYLNSLSDPEAHFALVLESLHQVRNAKALKFVLDHYSKQGLSDSNTHMWYQARLKHLEGNCDDAIAAYRKLLSVDNSLEDKRKLHEEILQCAIEKGTSVEDAYQLTIDREFAFKYLTQNAASQLDSGRLRKLLELRDGEANNQSVQDAYCAGTADLIDGEFERAFRTLANGLNRTEPESELYGSLLSKASKAAAKCNKIAELYAVVEEKETIFEYLIESLSAERDADQMQRLLAIHEPHASDAESLTKWKARILEIEGKPKQAAELIAKLSGERRSVDNLVRYLDLMCDAGEYIDAYEHAWDHDAAFSYLAGKLVTDKQWETLLSLVSAHEPRSKHISALRYYEGLAFDETERSDEAIRAFRDGLSSASSPMIASLLRERRMLSFAKQDAIDKAWQYSDRSVEAFNRLCTWFQDQRAPEGIEELIKLRGEQDAYTRTWQSVVYRLRGDYPASLQAIVDALPYADAMTRSSIVDELFDTCVESDNAIFGYEHAKDKEAAFVALCQRLAGSRKTSELERLCERRAKDSEKDPWLPLYRAIVGQLSSDSGRALELYRTGLRNAGHPAMREIYRAKCVEILYELDRWQEAYEQIAPPHATFDQLAILLSRDERGSDLRKLVSFHHKVYPNDRTLPLWEIEAFWLTKQYQTLIAAARKHEVSLLVDSRNQGRFEDRLIRSLGRIGHRAEAFKEAQKSTSRDGDPWFELVVHCITKDAAKADMAAAACLGRGYSYSDFVSDPDISAAFESKDFEAVKRKYADGDN